MGVIKEHLDNAGICTKVFVVLVYGMVGLVLLIPAIVYSLIKRLGVGTRKKRNEVWRCAVCNNKVLSLYDTSHQNCKGDDGE